MTDHSTLLSKLKQAMKQFVEERDWTAYHHPKELAIALSIECNELLELFLFKTQNLVEILEDKDLMQSISEEIADILAYLLSIVNTLNLDLTTIYMKKMHKNRQKYPISEFKGNFKKK